MRGNPLLLSSSIFGVFQLVPQNNIVYTKLVTKFTTIHCIYSFLCYKDYRYKQIDVVFSPRSMKKLQSRCECVRFVSFRTKVFSILLLILEILERHFTRTKLRKYFVF